MPAIVVFGGWPLLHELPRRLLVVAVPGAQLRARLEPLRVPRERGAQAAAAVEDDLHHVAREADRHVALLTGANVGAVDRVMVEQARFADDGPVVQRSVRLAHHGHEPGADLATALAVEIHHDRHVVGPVDDHVALVDPVHGDRLEPVAGADAQVWIGGDLVHFQRGRVQQQQAPDAAGPADHRSVRAVRRQRDGAHALRIRQALHDLQHLVRARVDVQRLRILHAGGAGRDGREGRRQHDADHAGERAPARGVRRRSHRVHVVLRWSERGRCVRLCWSRV